MRSINAPQLVLLVAAIVAVGPALAQSSSESSSTSDGAKQKGAAAQAPTAKKAPAERRLDFVPRNAVKETAAGQGTAPAATQSKPGSMKEGSHCHSKAGDA